MLPSIRDQSIFNVTMLHDYRVCGIDRDSGIIQHPDPVKNSPNAKCPISIYFLHNFWLIGDEKQRVTLRMHYSVKILELNPKTLGNYSFDANRRQTFDSSAKKYLNEPFLWRSPIVSLIDNDAIEAYRDDERSNG